MPRQRCQEHGRHVYMIKMALSAHSRIPSMVSKLLRVMGLLHVKHLHIYADMQRRYARLWGLDPFDGCPRRLGRSRMYHESVPIKLTV